MPFAILSLLIICLPALLLAYVSEEIKGLSNVSSAEKSWKGYIISHKAILDPNTAWTEAIDLISIQLDPGISKSQVLYWISTQDGFSQSISTSTKSDIGGSSCESHASCSAMNLSGHCCPTNEGVMLECCS